MPQSFNCSTKATKVDVLVFTGRNDILVPPQGMITTKLPTDMDVQGFPPIEYSIWALAKQNVNETDGGKPHF